MPALPTSVFYVAAKQYDRAMQMRTDVLQVSVAVIKRTSMLVPSGLQIRKFNETALLTNLTNRSCPVLLVESGNAVPVKCPSWGAVSSAPS
eukprot:COSAG02_NODE_5_length_66751_cov_63.939148_58_plen_91_part_00